MKFFKRLFKKIKAQPPHTQSGHGPVVQSICITMVKNEQDIIEPFLRTNRPFFDAMILMDNGSTDNTRSIVVSCASELGGIFLLDLPRYQYAQSQYVTSALHHAQAAFFADFISFLDADECVAAASKEAFLAALAHVPVGGVSMHPWQTFLPDPDAAPTAVTDPLSRLAFRREVEKPSFSKIILRMGGGLDPQLIVRRGAHSVSSGDSKKPAIVPMPDMPIRHFPVRSSSQILAKAVLGWMANLANDPALKDARVSNVTPSFQWKRLFDVASGGSINLSPQQLSSEAMVYAQHAAPQSFADNSVAADNGLNLRRAYSDGQPADFYKTVATSLIQSGKRPPVFVVQPPIDIRGGKAGISTAFDSDWHWQHIYFDAAPFRSFIERHRPTSVFDVGCGKGLYLQFFRELGVKDVFGVDGVDRSVTVLGPAEYAMTDLHLRFDADRRFEVVFCLEVAEHLNPDATDTLFDTIAAHAERTIVFSMAEPGQPGHGHINCRTMEGVLAMWQARGWVPDLIETLGFRALSTMSWFRRNVVVLKRATSGQEDFASARLCQIAAMKYRWYAQETGVRHYALDDPYPQGSAGYGTVKV